MKKVNINFNFSNKTFYLAIGILAIIAVVGFVYAGTLEQWQIHGHPANEVEDGGSGGSFSCPQGFTKVGKLGCIQDNSNDEATYHEAEDDCYNNYEGRLPSFNELSVAVRNSFTTLQTNNHYWIDSSHYLTSIGGGLGTLYYRSDRPQVTFSGWGRDDSTMVDHLNYTCFIPASGGSGISSCTDVAITNGENGDSVCAAEGKTCVSTYYETASYSEGCSQTLYNYGYGPTARCC